SLDCGQVEDPYDMIACHGTWSGGFDAATASFSPVPYDGTGQQNAVAHTASGEFGCGALYPHGPDNTIAYDPQTITFTVTDPAGQTASATATVLCWNPGW